MAADSAVLTGSGSGSSPSRVETLKTQSIYKSTFPAATNVLLERSVSSKWTKEHSDPAALWGAPKNKNG